MQLEYSCFQYVKVKEKNPFSIWKILEEHWAHAKLQRKCFQVFYRSACFNFYTSDLVLSICLFYNPLHNIVYNTHLSIMICMAFPLLLKLFCF